MPGSYLNNKEVSNNYILHIFKYLSVFRPDPWAPSCLGTGFLTQLQSFPCSGLLLLFHWLLILHDADEKFGASSPLYIFCTPQFMQCYMRVFFFSSSNLICLPLRAWQNASCPRQASLSMELPRQEYWTGEPFPLPGDLPHLGLEPNASPELAGRFFTTVSIGKPLMYSRSP